MWVVAGLGNPGKRYEGTRHNAGFAVVDALAGRHGISLRQKDNYMFARGCIKGAEAILMQPLTFMNLSGHAVRAVLGFYKIPASSLIVVHDDMDIEPGRIKIREGGGAAGHNGISSIIEQCGTRDFIRVKVGIGRPPAGMATSYVLERFSKGEMVAVAEAFADAAAAVEAILDLGVLQAMNTFNQRA